MTFQFEPPKSEKIAKWLANTAAHLESLTDTHDRADFIDDCASVIRAGVNRGSINAFDGDAVLAILDGWRQSVREAA